MNDKEDGSDESDGRARGEKEIDQEGGLENGWESQGGIDHMSLRGGRVRMVRVTIRNG